MQERMVFIDKLKALAMMLVVMGHTIYFCIFHEQSPHDSIFNVICTFHVPLFFFLSGFVISQAPTIPKFLGKARRFLVPMLVVGLINALLIDKVRDFFLDGGHNGYWYLLTLTIFYLLLVPFQLTKEKKGVSGFIIDCCLSIILWLCLTFSLRVNNSVTSAVNCWACFAFWRFFAIGFLLRKYALTSFFTRQWSVIVFPVAYLILLIVSFGQIETLPQFLDFTIALLAILALFSLFQVFGNTGTSFLSRQLLLIGNNTLGIYVYHYFFIRFIDLSFLQTQCALVKLLVIVPLTLLITYSSIAVNIIVKKYYDSLLKPIKENPLFYISLLLLGSISVFFIHYYGISRFHSEMELFSDVYMLCLLMMIVPLKWRRRTKIIVFSCLLVVGFIDMLCYQLMGSPLIPSIVITWLQTNWQEANEAIGTYFSLKLLLSPLLLFMLLPLVIYWLKRLKLLIPHRVASLLLIITLFSLAGSIDNKRYLYYIFTRTSDDDMEEPCNVVTNTREYLPVYRLLFSAKEISRLKTMRQRLLDNAKATTVDSCSFRSPLIVLIIGESYNRHHASLYGYNKPTTPLQDKRLEHGELYRFNDVIASYNLTYKAFQHMLSLYDYDEHGSWYNYPLLPVLFRKAGYEVDFFSNQYSLNKQSAFSDFIEDSFINNRDLSPLLFDHRNAWTHTYDIELIDDYKHLPKGSRQTPQLVIFHFLGIHVDFFQRFPPEWQHFHANDYDRKDLDESQRQVIADYDNAIRYNDYVVDSIINTFSDQEAVIMYVPDHGELVYDGGTDFGRNFQISKEHIKPQYDIPFWIHCTDAYKTAHPAVCQQMANAVDRPFMTDDLPHLLLYLSGIRIPQYQPDRNLIDDNYNSRRKRLIQGKTDYDSVCK